MILLKDVVIVLRTNQTTTTLLDELKLASIAIKSLDSKDYDANYRVFIESKITKDTTSAKIVIDGITTLHTDNVDIKTYMFHKDKRLPLECNVCKSNSTPLLPLFLADKPTILIHVHDKLYTHSQSLTSIIDHCFAFLSTFKFSPLKTTTPIRQVIVSLTDKSTCYINFYQSFIKIVVDGQLFYDGRANTRWNEVPEKFTCVKCS